MMDLPLEEGRPNYTMLNLFRDFCFTLSYMNRTNIQCTMMALPGRRTLGLCPSHTILRMAANDLQAFPFPRNHFEIPESE